MNLFHCGSTVPRVALALMLGGATAALSQDPPVIFALDSSRSLSTAESRATADLAKELEAGLPAPATSGTLAFDDEVRWLARPGAPGAGAALDAMTPSGRYTVLNDGLIEAVRALGEGGVLVLLSDGKDENSATTLEDAVRMASDRGVRLVTIGAGRADERILRRLALLTGGLYAGRVGALDPGKLLQEIESLRREAAASRAARTPAAPIPTPGAPASGAAGVAGASGDSTGASTPAPPGRAAPPADGWPSASWLLAIGAALAACGIVLGFLLARRRTASSAQGTGELERGTQPGVHWPPASASTIADSTPGAAPVPVPILSTFAAPRPIDEVQIARARLRPAVRPQGLMEISLDETAEFQRLPFSESIERTLVLTAEVVLTVREPGRPARSYRLPPEKAVDIGRDAALNTLSFQDPTMSTQHLRVVLDDDEVHLVDLGSTNGVLVGERRIDAVHLQPGDRFRAGMIEFELGLHHGSSA